MKSLQVVLGILALVPFLSTACVTPPKGIATIKGTEQEDIPVPRDFEFKESESPDLKGISEESRFRSWHGSYRGTGYVGDIASWYIGEMRKHGWRFKSRSEQVERRKLCFEKQEEVSEIQIYRVLDSSAGGYVTMVRAEIHPRGPEDLTVDEHLQAPKEPEIKPASFSPKDLPASDSPPPAGGSKSKKAKPKARGPQEGLRPSEISRPAADTEIEGPAKDLQKSSSSASGAAEALSPGDALQPKEPNEIEK